MHWVDRGPEPDGLVEIRERYTHRWICYYRQGRGARPSDARWREFRPHLCLTFHGLCAYCEEACRGEVDHFWPKSGYPEKVYQWSNWFFACHDCNRAKGDKHPSEGYVNPCSEDSDERPEGYFTFDTLTGLILPRSGLNPVRHNRAVTMIRDLDLNALHHLKKRKVEMKKMILMEKLALEEGGLSRSQLADVFGPLATPDKPLSSIIRVWLCQRGFS